METWLRQESRGLRALTRGLLSDESDADDAIQDTWVAALRSRPERPGPWLHVVLRRLVFRRARAERRRRRRESAAARPEATPSASDVVEGLDLRRRVVEAVAALEEPYRSAVVLRYFHDRSPAEVAEIQCVPLATAKTRLHRALVRLRASLDEEHGGTRAAWQAPLAALLDPPAGGAAAAGHTLAAGGVLLVMKKVVALVVLVILLGGGGVAVWRVLDRPQPDAAPEREASSAHATPVLDGRPTALVPKPQEEDVTDLRPVAGVTVIDATGQPVSGATVRISRMNSSTSVQGTTGADGTVRIPVDAPGMYRLEADHQTGGSGTGQEVLPRAVTVQLRRGAELVLLVHRHVSGAYPRVTISHLDHGTTKTLLVPPGSTSPVVEVSAGAWPQGRVILRGWVDSIRSFEQMVILPDEGRALVSVTAPSPSASKPGIALRLVGHDGHDTFPAWTIEYAALSYGATPTKTAAVDGVVHIPSADLAVSAALMGEGHARTYWSPPEGFNPLEIPQPIPVQADRGMTTTLRWTGVATDLRVLFLGYADGSVSFPNYPSHDPNASSIRSLAHLHSPIQVLSNAPVTGLTSLTLLLPSRARVRVECEGPGLWGSRDLHTGAPGEVGDVEIKTRMAASVVVEMPKTFAPVGVAELNLTGTRGGPGAPLRARVSPEGRAVFSGLPPAGRAIVTAYTPTASAAAEIDITSASEHVVAFREDSFSSQERTVRVVDTSGAPIQGAKVGWMSPPESTWMETDAEGFAELRAPALGTPALIIDAVGYLGHFGWPSKDGAIEQVTLQPAASVSIKFSAALGDVVVRVVDARGRRVATVEAAVLGASEFTQYGLAPGEYIVELQQGDRIDARRVTLTKDKTAIVEL